MVTNIFRDQMDAMESSATYQMILDAILSPNCNVLLSSPLFNSQTLSNPIQYWLILTNQSHN